MISMHAVEILPFPVMISLLVTGFASKVNVQSLALFISHQICLQSQRGFYKTQELSGKEWSFNTIRSCFATHFFCSIFGLVKYVALNFIPKKWQFLKSGNFVCFEGEIQIYAKASIACLQCYTGYIKPVLMQSLKGISNLSCFFILNLK